MKLSVLSDAWWWLRWPEILPGLAILLGVYVRFCAIVLMVLGLLALTSRRVDLFQD